MLLVGRAKQQPPCALHIPGSDMGGDMATREGRRLLAAWISRSSLDRPAAGHIRNESLCLFIRHREVGRFASVSCGWPLQKPAAGRVRQAKPGVSAGADN